MFNRLASLESVIFYPMYVIILFFLCRELLFICFVLFFPILTFFFSETVKFRKIDFLYMQSGIAVSLFQFICRLQHSERLEAERIGPF